MRAGPPVRRVDIDISTDATWDESTNRALDARITPIYNAYVGVTGFAAIAATDTNEVIACVKRPQTAADVARVVAAARALVAARPRGQRIEGAPANCPAPRRMSR